ncbi:amidoligase family protein [uncultured Bacteroides sp.]|uniref:amidoligase family protein n=1 Tax=uncultured Bacteroides sp. TaxID=162156 RepID=UPI0026345295|nr:amidoligase family protein [uncultured Bacteroides sp.]
MNEQITAILSQTTTKTRKIEQLLQLGLTRRQVADLVTNGNYGFVQNVYKKMLSRTVQTIPASIQLDYTFTRKFGIEIEAYNCTREKLASELRSAGIDVAVEGYNHTTRNHWKLVTDSSLTGNNTFELVSPVLEGEAGLKELEKVCWVLEYCDVKVNDSCGLHIHMDAADFDLQTWKNLALSYKHLERVIDSFMPQSRRQNYYCKGLSSISAADIQAAQNINDLRAAFGNNRYRKVNLEAYARHRTVEFRQHSGTTNFTKMENWVRFLNGLITFAKSGIAANTSLENIPFLDEKQKLFYKLRTKKLAR